MVRKFLLISLGIALVLGIFFHRIILTSTSGWAFQLYTSHSLGESIQFKSLELEGFSIVLNNPCLTKKHQFCAERAKLTFDMHWKSGLLDIHVDLERPVLKVSPSKIGDNPLKPFLRHENHSWIKINPIWIIHDGIFKWDLDDGSEGTLHLTLQADKTEGRGLQAHFGESNSRENAIALQSSHSDDGMIIECHCAQLHCGCVRDLMTLFFPSVRDWKIPTGSLNGIVKAHFPHRQRPYLVGEMLIDNFSFAHTDSTISGSSHKARLHLERNPNLVEENHTTIGYIDIFEPGNITKNQGKENGWRLDSILGKIELDPNKNIIIDLVSKGVLENSVSSLKLNGKANLDSHRFFELSLDATCSTEGKQDGKVHLEVAEHGENRIKKANLDCKRISPIEWRLLQTLFSVYWPSISQLSLEEGTIDTTLQATLTANGIETVESPFFQGQEVRFKFLPWKTEFSFIEWLGHGSIDLSQKDVWGSLNGELKIGDGLICRGNETPSSCSIRDINSHIRIHQGHIHQTLVKMHIGRLKGTMDVDWGNAKRTMMISLDGNAADLIELFPPLIDDKITNDFNDRSLHISADITDLTDRIEMKGSMRLGRPTLTGEFDLIHFGSEFLKNSEKPGLIEAPIGWFYARDLPLEQYLSPLIFPKEVAVISGVGEFKGSFDAKKIDLHYNLEQVKIENEKFRIDIPTSYSNDPGQMMGFHVFDLAERSHHGSLPIEHASYEEKNTGLFFSDISAKVLFQDDQIHFQSLETLCEGVIFAGNLDLDYRNPHPGFFSLILSAPHIQGKVSRFQDIIAHFSKPTLFNQIPLEGDIEGKNGGLKLRIDFIPDDYLIESHFEGSVTQGTLPIAKTKAIVQGLYMDVEYEHRNRSLKLTEIQGSLLVGRPGVDEEYQITSDSIQFHEGETNQGQIDITLSDHNHPLARFAAEINTLENGLYSVILDKHLSHFCHVYPSKFSFTLKEGWDIQQFEYEADFRLDAIWKDLQSLARAGLLMPDIVVPEKWQALKDAAGDFNLIVAYDYLRKSLNYEIKAEKLRFNKLAFNSFYSKGRKQEKKWMIDFLQLDRLSLYADIQNRNDKWKVDFLGVNYGQSILVGLEGDFLENEWGLNANVQLLEIRLEALDEWKDLRAYVSRWNPKGTIECRGNLKVELSDEQPGYKLDLSLVSQPSEIQWMGNTIDILKPVHISYDSQTNLTLSDLKCCLKNGIRPQACFAADILNYDFRHDTLTCSKIDFEVPNRELSSLTNVLQKSVPEFIDDRLKEHLMNIKPEGDFKGQVSLVSRPLSYHVNARLGDGIYHFKKRNYPLKDLQLEITPQDLSFSAMTHVEQFPFKIEGNAHWPSLEEGRFILASDTPNPLFIRWKDPASKGWQIESIHGQFCGMNIDLDQASEEGTPGWSILQGKLDININELSPLLIPETAAKINQLELAGHYCFKGTYWINPNLGNTVLQTTYFDGELSCQNSILKGFQIKAIDGKLEYKPGHLEGRDLVFNDAAGSLSCPNLNLSYEQPIDDWVMDIPFILVKNLRPSLLKDVNDSQNPRNNPLIIRRIELNNFHGHLNNTIDWQGNGVLHFLNSSKKNLNHPLFAIPSEIILRLGLNPYVLNPVTGTIYFTLRGNKFYLNRFKDVYSEGRGSRFYLADSGSPSWIDLNGNLSVQIRMKQYNLIFKLAELFTVSINGNLKKMRYGLQKHEKTPRNGYLLGIL